MASTCPCLHQLKGRFVSARSFHKWEVNPIYCKRLDSSQVTSSDVTSTAVHAEEPVKIGSEITWDKGRWVVELRILAKGLDACRVCQWPLELKNVTNEMRYGLASLLYIWRECANINTVYTGKSHCSWNLHRRLPIYDVNTKLATGMVLLFAFLQRLL